ncbi:MAG TPA: pitrilysin family protein [Telluria sp.]|nr:pitrilysin family protein [Telluria sp.]
MNARAGGAVAHGVSPSSPRRRGTMALRIAAAACVALVAGAAHAQTLPAIPFEKYTLPNGLEVILAENHRLPIVAVNIWYHVGPANEAPGLTGFAHLFEHMMFAATRHVPRGLADRLLEGAGATDSNGSTEFDRTNYYDTVPSNQLELPLWIHADRMGYLLDVLDQTALANQQDVVRNERRQVVENRPYGLAEEALHHLLFPQAHPYHAWVIGSHADIQHARLADVRAFFQRYYGPNNASLVIAGDFDPARARALVSKYFGGLRPGPAVARAQADTPPITAERRTVVPDRVELPRVFLGWLTPIAMSADDAALTLAAQILGGGKSSRLYQSLVYGRQIAQEVNASQNSLALSSIFTVDLLARPGHTAQELEQACDAELADLAAHGPSAAELERARNAVETALVARAEKLGGEGLANLLNQYNQYAGDPGYLPKDIERYRQVTAADVQHAVARYLRRDARAVVHAVPGAPDFGPPVPTPPATRRKSAPGQPVNPDQAWRYRVPRPGPAPQLAPPASASFKLPNGLTVIHHHNPALPLVAADLVVRAGSEADPAERPGLAGFTAHMLQEGTATRSAPQIAADIAQLGTTLDADSTPDAAHLGVTALKANFARALDQLADVALHPSFPDPEVERQRASRLADLTRQREEPQMAAAVAGAAALYGPAHPYGHSQLGTEAAIRATTRADLARFWQQRYTPDNAALVVAGDITSEELRALATERFGAWKPATAAPVPLPAAPAPRPRLILVDQPGAQQTALRVTTIGAPRTAPDYPALQVMNAAFGGLFSSRLNANLREDKGYTYGAFSHFDYRRGAGPFAIDTSVRTDATGASLREIAREAHAMRARPLRPAELANARNAQILSLPGQFDTNHGIGASLAELYLYGLPDDYYARLPAQLAQVTAAQVQAAARAYLAPEKMVVIGVGDVRAVAPQLKALRLGPAERRNADGELLP